MMQHPGVAEAAVIGVPDEGKGEAIVGYAVSARAPWWMAPLSATPWRR